MFIRLNQIVLKGDDVIDVPVLINTDCLMSATFVEYTKQMPIIGSGSNTMQTTVVKLTGVEPIHVKETVEEIATLING